MKFTAEKSQIVDSLQNAAAVAERRQTIPVLANLRLKASSGKLEVTATDLEIQIKNYSDLLSIEEGAKLQFLLEKCLNFAGHCLMQKMLIFYLKTES